MALQVPAGVPDELADVAAYKRLLPALVPPALVIPLPVFTPISANVPTAPTDAVDCAVIADALKSDIPNPETVVGLLRRFAQLGGGALTGMA